MAFIDEIKLSISAGRGGTGVIRFRHEKGKAYGGPSGGDGGSGGDVYVVGSRSHHSLVDYKNKKVFEAERGEDGLSNSSHGKSGKDLILSFPVGTVLKNLETKEEISIEEDGQKILLLKGGNGGYGNEHFKSSVNQAPRKTTPGKEGEHGRFFIELRLFADLGLVGFPNAGKTSFLNAMTSARGVVGDYQFTTLEPNLGDFYGYIIADIPGLIEGASIGKGLGFKFLRHIKRTKVILHLLSLENSDPLKVYKSLRKEMKEFDESLLEKDEIVILTKTDLVDKKTLAAVTAKIKKLSPKVLNLSLYDDASIKKVKDELVKILNKKNKKKS